MQTAQTADPRPAILVDERDTALPLRGDTVLGVCEALGEDFGFNPVWLRVAFCPFLFLNPAATVGAYFALGAVVLASRLAAPKPKPAPAAPVEEQSEPERLAA